MKGTPVSDDQTPAPRSGDDTPTAPGAPEAAPRTVPPAPPVPPAPTTDTPSPAAPAGDAPPAPAYGVPQAPPAYGPPASPIYDAPAAPSAPSYGAPGGPAYGSAPYGTGYGAAVRTNVLAIISLVASIAGFLWVLPVIGPIAAVVTGHISLAQIKRTGEKGRGMALAGTIVGWVGVGFLVVSVVVLLFIGVGIAASNSSRYGA
jgi:hypothetical protein